MDIKRLLIAIGLTCIFTALGLVVSHIITLNALTAKIAILAICIIGGIYYFYKALK